MIDNFNQFLHHLIRFRQSDFSKLNWSDINRLVGRYLLEANFNNAWKLIANTNQTHLLPQLLGEFLLGKRNGPYALQRPELTLSYILGENALKVGKRIIEKSWEREKQDTKFSKSS